MHFPGSNELHLTDESVMSLIESALNSSAIAGDQRIRVTALARGRYGIGITVDITTDYPTPTVTALEHYSTLAAGAVAEAA